MSCSFWDIYDDTYIAYSVMACRRHIKYHKDSISLIGLLKDIVENPAVMSRDRFVDFYHKHSDLGNKTFDKNFAGACKGSY